MITITQQPQNADVNEGDVATLSVTATTNIVNGEITYQWYESTRGAVPNATSSTLVFDPALEGDTGAYYVIVTDDDGSVTSDTALLTVEGEPKRVALVWNYEDDNFSWMDASAENNGVLEAVRCMKYGFEPGWTVRWSDLPGVWSDYDTTTWDDFSELGNEEIMYWLTRRGVWRSDQEIVIDGLKEYFVERVGIAPNDFNPQWTSNNLVHIKQFYFHMESSDITVEHNTFDISVGWANNLMDDPDYTSFDTINLQRSRYNGKVKWDFRSTGRFMALRLNFDETHQFAMTGGDIDVSLSHGR